MTKEELRKRALEVRRAMSPADVAANSRLIMENLLRLEVVRLARTVLCYVSSKDNEADTHDLIDHFLREKRTVLVPISIGLGELAWSSILSRSELAPGRFAILEPRPEFQRIVAPPPDAPIVVPGIAFTRDGYRLGYGLGFFDRFLAHHPGPKLGLAFECQIIGSFEPDTHDVPMSAVITETAVYTH